MTPVRASFRDAGRGRSRRFAAATRQRTLKPPPVAADTAPVTTLSHLINAAAVIVLALGFYRSWRGRHERTYPGADIDARVSERTQQLEVTLEQLVAAQQAAQSTADGYSRLLARLGREVRTPMGAVLETADKLRLSPLNPRQQQLAEVLHRSARSVIDVIDDLREGSRLQNPATALAPVPFDPRAAVEDAVELLTPGAQAKGIEVVLALGRSLPTSCLASPARLRQVISNLVGYAIRETSQGQVVITGDAKPAHDGRLLLHFSVSDTGPGIPASLKSGLGLAMAKEQVDLMRGRIEVHSEPGRGTRFEFSIPVQPDRDLRESRAVSTLRGQRVLLIESHAAARAALAAQLEQYGVEMEIAADMTQALTRLRTASESAPFRAVLLDARLATSATPEGTLLRAIESDSRLATLRVVLLGLIPPEMDEASERLPRCVQATVSRPLRISRLIEALSSATPEEIAALVPDASAA